MIRIQLSFFFLLMIPKYHLLSVQFNFNRLTPEYFLFSYSGIVQNQLNEAEEECWVAGRRVSTIQSEAMNMNNF